MPDVTREVQFVNELGRTITLSVERNAESVTIIGTGPDSRVEHTWTPREADHIVALLAGEGTAQPDREQLNEQRVKAQELLTRWIDDDGDAWDAACALVPAPVAAASANVDAHGFTDTEHDTLTELIRRNSDRVLRLLGLHIEANERRALADGSAPPGLVADLRRLRASGEGTAQPSPPWAGNDVTGSTLLLGIWFPNCPPDTDPEIVADCVAVILNEERDRNGGTEGAVEIAGIPAPQWLTPETLANLKRAASGEGTAPQPDES